MIRRFFQISCNLYHIYIHIVCHIWTCGYIIFLICIRTAETPWNNLGSYLTGTTNFLICGIIPSCRMNTVRITFLIIFCRHRIIINTCNSRCSSFKAVKRSIFQIAFIFNLWTCKIRLIIINIYIRIITLIFRNIIIGKMNAFWINIIGRNISKKLISAKYNQH